MPARFSSDESSPDGAAGSKETEDKKGVSRGSKRKEQTLKKKPAKKSKGGEDDDDEDADPDHDALPGGNDDDDDDEIGDFGLEGLDDLLKLDGERSGKPSKEPATSNRGTKKKPSTRKRDEAHCHIDQHISNYLHIPVDFSILISLLPQK